MAALGLVVTAAIAVGGPFLTRRDKKRRAASARLQVTTTRWMPNGLRLEFRYEPEFAHTATRARVAVKSPGVRLMRGRPVLNPAPMATGGYIRYEFDCECIEGIGLVALMPTDNSGALSAVMFLLPDGTGEWILRNAQIEVSIVDASGKQLLKRTYDVSPIGEGPGTMFSEPDAIRPVMVS
ncbi:MAG: hypothetical protein KGJ78_14400 [Alphaproteobacteria bacterium]|nr:hypothetical protein [Alphaproteobacteria bacterium]